jgi:hypothetical protein
MTFEDFVAWFDSLAGLIRIFLDLLVVLGSWL